jgi:hypothetical protein
MADSPTKNSKNDGLLPPTPQDVIDYISKAPRFAISMGPRRRSQQSKEKPAEKSSAADQDSD